MNESVESLLSLIPALNGCTLNVSALDGGRTNRNYVVDAGKDKFVLRLVGQGTNHLGIDRQMEYAYACAAAELDLSGEVIAFLPDHGATLTRFVPGRTLTAACVQDPKCMARVVAALKTLHNLRINLGRFSVFEAARRNYNLAVQNKVVFPSDIERALLLLDRIEAAVGSPGTELEFAL